MKMFRPALAGVLPAFVLFVCIQLNGRVACTPPPPDMQSWFTGDDTVNDHIWQRVGTLYNAAIYATAKVATPSESRQPFFEDRVAYQRAFEEVYWRHRIWPKERPDRKPSLDAVMSQAQIEKKVQDYLRKSELLEQEWQKPITPEQLQTEMERMASHTKQPEVLRELFAALGNDPFVIAECLARPVLAERFANGDPVAAAPNAFGAAHPTRMPPQKPTLAGWLAKTETQVPMTMAAVTSANYTLPVIASPSGGCIDNTWTPTTLTNAPSARFRHTAVWTGSEMIVWGGARSSITFFNTGGRYDPSTDSWSATSTISAPSERADHTAIWTGSEMIVWGGDNNSNVFNTGGRYNPATNSWTATSTTNAPTERVFHTAVWTSSEMIVWGGFNISFDLNTGGRYNPVMDSWIATSTSNAPEQRDSHTAVWTNSEMIVWGGIDVNGGNVFNSGGKYNANIDSWAATTTTNAPSSRNDQTAVWTSTEMIVWGGQDQNGVSLGTGGRYSPNTDTWIATSTTNAPTARYLDSAVWTGDQMIIWGGFNTSSGVLNTGGRYNPSTGAWTGTSTSNAPTARAQHAAVWTGNEMIVWGGADNAGNPLNTGGRYCAQAGGLTLVSAASIQRGFAIDLPISGPSGVEDRSGGPNKKFYVAMTFNNNITSVGSATTTCGGVSTWSISGNTVTFKLVGVAHGCNESDITITANDVMDDMGNTLSSASVAMGLLLGDVNGDRVVDGTDLSIVRSYRGQHTDGTNYRSDVSNDGFINVSDVQLVQQQQGTSLP